MTEQNSTNRQIFSALEKSALAECAEKFKNVIENKQTDGVTNRQKKEAWSKISADFNSVPGVTRRNSQQLLNCYRNLKRKATKRKAEERVARFLTGGGPAVVEENAAIDDRLIAIGAIAEPLLNIYDSDHAYHLQTSSCLTRQPIFSNAINADTLSLTEMEYEDENVDDAPPTQASESFAASGDEVPPSASVSAKRSEKSTPMLIRNKHVPRSLQRSRRSQATASAAAASALQKQTETKIRTIEEQHEFYKKEHELRMLLLQKQINVQDEILSILKNNPEKLNININMQ